MSKPTPYLFRMALFLVALVVLAGVLYRPLSDAFFANAVLNSIILTALAIGIVLPFRTVVMLGREALWVEVFQRGQSGSVGTVSVTPRLLAPAATMLGERADRSARLSLSTTAMQTLLDGVASRLDESREINRYMVGLLVFLGLLGTFWGLLQTVNAVGLVIGDLNVGGSDVAGAFEELKGGLQSPLAGMGTAFSSSLFGLAGSLVIGFLGLQAGQAQNRFYNDLEEWLSGLTRLSGGGGPVGDGVESVPAYIQALLEQTADSLDNLQRSMARTEDSRVTAKDQMADLTAKIDALSDTMKTEQNLLLKLAEGQLELQPALKRLAEGQITGAAEEQSRAHIRNIETYLARMLEEMSSGRAETMQDLRAEIRLLARTLAAALDGKVDTKSA